MMFKVEYSDIMNVTLPTDRTFSLITGTPIITRIRKEKYEGMAEQHLKNGYEYVYWRMDPPVRKLHINLAFVSFLNGCSLSQSLT